MVEELTPIPTPPLELFCVCSLLLLIASGRKLLLGIGRTGQQDLVFSTKNQEQIRFQYLSPYSLKI